MRGFLMVLLALSAGCDDTLFLPAEPYTADWSGMEVFFADQCLGCHPSVDDSILLPFDVQRDLCEELGTYVIPGDPEGSLLWRIIGGDPRPGDPPPMPFGRPLPSHVTDVVRDWIEAGAPVDGC